MVDELEVRVHRAAHPLPVVRRRQHRAANLSDYRVAVGVQQRQIELELAGKVLVQHRFRDAGALRDVVHRGRVVTVGDEDLLGRGEQLLAARGARQPRGTRGLRAAGRSGHDLSHL